MVKYERFSHGFFYFVNPDINRSIMFDNHFFLQKKKFFAFLKWFKKIKNCIEWLNMKDVVMVFFHLINPEINRSIMFDNNFFLQKKNFLPF